METGEPPAMHLGKTRSLRAVANDVAANTNLPSRRSTGPERCLQALLGALVFGIGSLLLGVLFGSGQLTALSLVELCLLFLIAFYGVNLLVQAFRGRAAGAGPFFALLRVLHRLGPRPFVLAYPTLATLTLLHGALGNDIVETLKAVRGHLFWSVWLLSIGAHELGHVVAARIGAMPLARVVVGPFELSKGPSGWRLEMSREWISLFGGYVRTAPGFFPARKHLLLALGGPIASLLLLLAAWLIGPYDLIGLWSGASMRHEVRADALQLGLLILASSLLPHQTLGLPSDGYQALEALRAMRPQRKKVAGGASAG